MLKIWIIWVLVSNSIESFIREESYMGECGLDSSRVRWARTVSTKVVLSDGLVGTWRRSVGDYLKSCPYLINLVKKPLEEKEFGSDLQWYKDREIVPISDWLVGFGRRDEP